MDKNVGFVDFYYITQTIDDALAPYNSRKKLVSDSNHTKIPCVTNTLYSE